MVPLLGLIWWQLIHTLVFQHLGSPLCCCIFHVNINFAIQSGHFNSSAKNSLRYGQQLLCRNVTAIAFKIWVGSDLHFDHQIAILTMLRPVAFSRHPQVDPIEYPLRNVDRLFCFFVLGTYSLASGTCLLVLPLPVATVAL